ncbi:MAG: type II toxin-antitoxin system RelE/ParE family toxin [Planctomycetota bacterium]|jgi:phage-related protein|nr:type II toxin-antitoxin system RelE/ParE family toxin [Planctomycetota bacterium]
MMKMTHKKLRWVGSSLRDMQNMPDEVKHAFGHALYMAQCGEKPVNAKVLRGFGSAAVLEVVESDPGGTYRAVYTVRFADAVYVLHCFQKKSTRGIATSKRDVALIGERLREAAALAEGSGHA